MMPPSRCRCAAPHRAAKGISAALNESHNEIRNMPLLTITCNDAWDFIPLEFVEEEIKFIEGQLQPAHPLRAIKLLPLAKCWRKFKYLVEDEDSGDSLWVLDMHRKKRIRGKTCYYFKRMETQEELDAMLGADYEKWVESMKDAGAWYGE